MTHVVVTDIAASGCRDRRRARRVRLGDGARGDGPHRVRRPAHPSDPAGCRASPARAVTVLAAPGDNLMVHAAIEQARAGDVIVVVPVTDSPYGFIGELMATQMQVRGVRALRHDRRRARHRRAARDGLPGVDRARQRAGHRQGHRRVGQRAGRRSAASSCDPGDVVVADDDGVTIVPRERAAEALEASRARAAKEAANRAPLPGRRDLAWTSTTCAACSPTSA